jgi:hypothetical protein
MLQENGSHPHFAIVASKIIVIAEQRVIWDSVNRLADEQAFIDRYRDENDVVVMDSLKIEIEEEEEDETVEEKEAKKARFMDARELERSLHKAAVTAAKVAAKAAVKAAVKAAAKAANDEEVEDLIRIGLQFLEDEEEQSTKIGCKGSEPSAAKAIEHQLQYSKENMIEEEDNVDDPMGLEVIEEEEEELIQSTIKKARRVYVSSSTKLASKAASKATALAEYQVKHSRRLAILERFGFDQYDSGYVTVKNLKDLARSLNLPYVTVKVNECISELSRQGLEKDRKPQSETQRKRLFKLLQKADVLFVHYTLYIAHVAVTT